jgi:hypothetical protein
MTEATQLRDRQFTGQTLTWGHPDVVSYVGRSTFDACDITITCPARGIILLDCVFRDCTIRVKRLANFLFVHERFERCRFIGNYPGCEFGYRDADNASATRGYARDCDFSQATLDLAAFNSGVDLARTRLPPWPHFLVDSLATLATVNEFADDPEWAGLASLPTRPLTVGIVVVYRNGGKRGFACPAPDARQILLRYPQIRVDSPQSTTGGG